MKVKNLNSHIEHIVNGCRQQSEFYKQMLEMSLQCSAYVSEGNIPNVEQILTERQKIIENISEIEDNINSHKEAVMNILHLKEFKLDGVKDLIFPELRQELNDLVKTNQQLIRRIIDVDHKNEEGIVDTLKDVTGEQKKSASATKYSRLTWIVPKSFQNQDFSTKNDKFIKHFTLILDNKIRVF